MEKKLCLQHSLLLCSKRVLSKLSVCYSSTDFSDFFIAILRWNDVGDLKKIDFVLIILLFLYISSNSGDRFAASNSLSRFRLFSVYKGSRVVYANPKFTNWFFLITHIFHSFIPQKTKQKIAKNSITNRKKSNFHERNLKLYFKNRIIYLFLSIELIHSLFAF